MYVGERWGAGVETQQNVRGEVRGWGRVPFNEPYTPSLSTIYDGAQGSLNFLKMVLDPSPPPLGVSQGVLLCAAVCCSVLQRVGVCCSVCRVCRAYTQYAALEYTQYAALEMRRMLQLLRAHRAARYLYIL